MRNLTSPAVRNWIMSWSERGPFHVGPDAGYGGTYRIYRKRSVFGAPDIDTGNARFVARTKGQAVAVCAALNWYEAFDEAVHTKPTETEQERPEFRDRGRSSG